MVSSHQSQPNSLPNPTLQECRRSCSNPLLTYENARSLCKEYPMKMLERSSSLCFVIPINFTLIRRLLMLMLNRDLHSSSTRRSCRVVAPFPPSGRFFPYHVIDQFVRRDIFFAGTPRTSHKIPSIALQLQRRHRPWTTHRSQAWTPRVVQLR